MTDEIVRCAGASGRISLHHAVDVEPVALDLAADAFELDSLFGENEIAGNLAEADRFGGAEATQGLDSAG